MIFLRSSLQAIIRSAIALVVLLPAYPLNAVAETSLPAARDLAADAQSAAQSAMPLIVLVSLAGCPHCDAVRRSHLLPLLRGGVAAPTPVIRQVEVNGSERLRNFNGREITHADFARRYKVKITPVVFFFDGKGVPLTEPLVGSMIPDFYGAYFDAAFNEAKSKLHTARSKN